MKRLKISKNREIRARLLITILILIDTLSDFRTRPILFGFDHLKIPKEARVHHAL